MAKQKRKKKYSQNWRAYNRAQLSEKIFFMGLLADLCSQVKQPEYKFGRPKIPYSDMLFSIVLKVYTTFSIRRFMSDVKIAKGMKLIDYVPCYSSVSNFMNKEELTDILKGLIKLSSLPLATIETDVVLDASGFSTSRFGRWFDYKWGKERKHKIWLKAHLCSGVKTNIVAAANVTESRVHDTKELPNLIEQTSENFNLKEVAADKAYLSKKNLEIIYDKNAIPFIPFKSNNTGKPKGSAIWKKMFHFFMYNRDEFMKHYHKRSNAETVFHMIKTKFGYQIKSKKETAQINELFCKILANNICVVIQEIHELGITTEIIKSRKISI